MNPDEPLVSVVVLNYNGRNFLDRCVSSILKSDHKNLDLIVVDNGSTDDSMTRTLARFGTEARLRAIFNGENLGYAGGNNVGIKAAQGIYVMILNNDTTVDTHCVSELVQVARRDKDIGAAQPKILLQSDKNRIDSTGGWIDFYGYSLARGHRELDLNQYNRSTEIFFAVGSAALYPRDLLVETGMFDEEFFMMNEDVDLSWRIRLTGRRVVYVPQAVVYHQVSGTLTHKPDLIILWCLRKNRISTLVKNYSFINLVKAIPVLLFFYVLIFANELFADHDMQKALTSLRAISHNLMRLRSLVLRRSMVQTRLRRISDKEILKHTCRVPVATRYLGLKSIHRHHTT